MPIKKLKPQSIKILKILHLFFAMLWICGGIALTILQMAFGTFILGPWINENVIIANQLRQEAFSDVQFLYNFQMIQIWGTVQVTFLLLYIIISVMKPWKNKQKG